MVGIDTAALALALGAGSLAAVNPCGFALLPAYLSAFVLDGDDTTQGVAVLRALRATVALTLGFATVFLAFGLLVLPVAAAVQAYVPVFTVALGLALALAGIWVAAGRKLPQPRLPGRAAGSGKPLTANWTAMSGFGASYAMASLGCTLAPFLAVVLTSFRSESPATGIAVFLAYAAGMGLTVGVAAVAVALARRGVVTSMRRAGSVVPRLGGVVLALAGAYVAWYGVWELRVLHGGAGADPIVTAALSGQSWIATRTKEAGALGLVVALALLLVLSRVSRRRHHPQPASPQPLPDPTFPQQAAQKEQS